MKFFKEKSIKKSKRLILTLFLAISMVPVHRPAVAAENVGWMDIIAFDSAKTIIPAPIFLDGEKKGVGAVNLSLAPNSYKVKFGEHACYEIVTPKDHKETAEVKAGELTVVKAFYKEVVVRGEPLTEKPAMTIEVLPVFPKQDIGGWSLRNVISLSNKTSTPIEATRVKANLKDSKGKVILSLDDTGRLNNDGKTAYRSDNKDTGFDPKGIGIFMDMEATLAPGKETRSETSWALGSHPGGGTMEVAVFFRTEGRLSAR